MSFLPIILVVNLSAKKIANQINLLLIWFAIILAIKLTIRIVVVQIIIRIKLHRIHLEEK